MSRQRLVDLRSDTVTRPTLGMRAAMAQAEVGDVCFGDDPTVTRLERAVAERLGKEAALFVPTGTMANQIAVAVHTRPGDAVLLDRRAHIALWEAGASAVLAGVQLVGVDSDDGLPTPDALAAAVYAPHVKAPQPRLLALEDTHNAAGGLAHNVAALAPALDFARQRGLATHLDGARLFNAAVATGDDVASLAAGFDTVSLCLSKGLGAPVGSLLAGPRDLIARADAWRHRLGGGWRQAGVLAAAGLHALDHHPARLPEDHARARVLAAAMTQAGVAHPVHDVQTNIVYFHVDPAWGTAQAFAAALADRGVLVGATAPQRGRLVTHLDVDDAALARASEALAAL